MNVLETLESLVTDVVKSRAFGGLSEENREGLRRDLELVEHLVMADEREPHIMVVGSSAVPLRDLVDELLVDPPIDLDVKERLGHGRWYPYQTAQGRIQLMDARADEGAFNGLRYHPADAIISVAECGSEDVSSVVGALLDALQDNETIWDQTPPAIVAIRRSASQREVADFVTQQALKTAIVESGLPRDYVDVVQLSRKGKLARTLVRNTHDEVRFALARLSPDIGTKRELAQSIIRLCSSINATIATIPLPIGSTVPITSVQVVMIAGIAYLSGREFSVRTIGEFVAALGLNVGAGLALREIARALVNWIPVAGSLVSATIAAGATTTLGNAAVKYFID